MASSVWPLEFWWIEDPLKEEYGDWSSSNHCSLSSL